MKAMNLPDSAELKLASLVIAAGEAETARALAQSAINEIEHQVQRLNETLHAKERVIRDATQVVLEAIAAVNENKVVGKDVNEKVNPNKYGDSPHYQMAINDLTGKRAALAQYESELAPIRKNLANLEHELTRQRSIAENAERRRQGAQVLSGRCQQWLVSQRGIPLTLAKPVTVELNDGETLVEALRSLRKEIVVVQAKLAEVKAIRLDVKSLKRQVPGIVSALKRAPTVAVTADDRLQVNFNLLAQGGVPLSLLAWLLPTTIEERLIDLIEAMPEATRTMSASQKAEAVAELERELLRLGRREESLCMRIEDEGGVVSRRHDAHPLAILGLKVGVSARATAAA
jgi:hypothetical protein